MTEVTHRDLARAAAAYLLEQRWCSVAFWELALPGGGQADAVGISDPSDDYWRRLYDRHIANPARNRHPGKRKPARIHVVEVKRHRSDLLADLRAGKMLQYERSATHCSLLVHPDCLLTGDPITELAETCLPSSWGLLVSDGRGVSSRRNARRLRPADEPATWEEARLLGHPGLGMITKSLDHDHRYAQRLVNAGARSMCYRALNPDSPVQA